jgi:hypothetical protein
MESERRLDPNAPDGWSPSQWRAFFEGALAAGHRAWHDPETIERLVARSESEKLALEALLAQAQQEIERVKAGPETDEENHQQSAARTEAKDEPSDGPWPDIPGKPPVRFARRLGTGQRWRRQAVALHAIARLGLSTRLEVLERVGAFSGVSPKSGSLKRLMADLVSQHLLASEVLTMVLSRPSRLAVCRLTEDGRELARTLGWEPVESDWDKLVRWHEGDKQVQHTAGVLTFAYHARKRGWNCTVLPPVQDGQAAPDVLVEKDAERVYVEVEFGEDRTEKWRAIKELQGLVALCAATGRKREKLVGECKLDGLKGMATDLESLIQDTGQGPLWLEQW